MTIWGLCRQAVRLFSTAGSSHRFRSLSLLIAASGVLMGAQAATPTPGTMAGSFSVDLAGAATYKISLDLPPGVAGLKPDLALVYNSNGGSDVLGLGWQIAGLSSITRCSQTVERDGQSVAPTLSDGDRFCLDGQRLIRTTTSTQKYDSPSNAYRTEIDNFQRVTSDATGVPAGNCSFGVGPATFSSVDRTGLTRTYGDTPDSVLVGTSRLYSTVICANPSRLMWPLTSVTDLHGNFINYIYNNTQNDPFSDAATVYIKEIDYGSSAGIVAKVVFTYSGFTGGIPDTHTQYVATTFTQTQPAVLSKIQVESASGAVLRTYNLHYSATVSLSQPDELTSVQECTSSGSLCYPATTFSYQGAPFNFSATPTKLADSGMQMRKVLDLDGDGLMDYVYCAGTCTDDTGELYVVFGNHVTGTGTNTNIPLEEGNYKLNYQNSVVVSAYGDGKEQLLIPYYPETGGQVLWKMLTLQGGTVTWTNPPMGTGGAMNASGYGNALGIDLTGTGRSDLVFSYNGHLWVRPNSANGYGPAIQTSVAVSGQPKMYPVNYDGGGAEMYVANTGIVEAQVTAGGANSDPTVSGLTLLQTGGSFDDSNLAGLVFVNSNGDGLSSAVVARSGYWCFYGNTGLGWDFNESNNCISGDTNAAAVAAPVDWYGDGRQEVIFPSGNTWHMFNAGQGPLPTEANYYETIVDLGSAAPVVGDYDSTSFLDVDGDGELDMIYTSGGVTYFRSNSAMPFLMTQITNGLGLNTDITYIPLAFAKYTSYVNSGGPTSAEAPQIIPYTGPLNVVRDFAADSGDFNAGTPIQIYTYYKYGTAAIDQWGRGFLGFSAVESLNYNSGLITLNTMSHTYPFQGMVIESDKYWNPSINPSTTSPQPAKLAATWATKCTIDTKNNEPDCPIHTQALEPATFTTGNLISKTVNTFDSITPNVSVVYPFIKDALVSNYVLSGSTTPYETIDTSYNYAIVGSSPAAGYNILAKSVTVTATGATDVAINKTAYTFGYESTCPGRASVIKETDSFGPIGAPTQYPDKIDTRTYDGTCNLTSDVKTIVSPTDNTYQLSVETDFTPDVYGNVLQRQVRGTNVPVRTTSMTYDSTQRFQASVTNSLGQGKTATYDSFGHPTKVVDENGLVMTYSYKFGRLAGSAGPDPSAGTVITYDSCTADCVDGTAYEVTNTDNDGKVTVTQYDPLQRPLRVISSGFNGTSIFQDTAYDILGRVSAVSKPYVSTAQSTSCWTLSQYDTLDRLVSKTQAAAHKDSNSQITCAGLMGTSADDVTTSVTYEADGFTTKSVTSTGNTTGPGSERVTVVYNILGKPAKVTDSVNGVNQYSYDPWGNQTSVTTPNGNVVSATYDSAGNRLTVQDPDLGAWSYSYDGAGDVLTQTDAAGQKLTNHYDALGRLIRRDNPDATVDVWQYDIAYGKGLGKLAYTLSGSGVWEGYAYDGYGHNSDKITVVNGQEYWVTTTYDDLGRVSQLVYPDMNGVNVSNQPNPPTGLTVAVDPNNAAIFDLTWQDTDRTGQIYHVYRAGTGANAAQVEIYSGPVIGWVDKTITVDDTYTWTVQACDGSGNCSAAATAQMVVVLPPSVPGVPQGPSGVQTATSWQVSWQPSNLGITGTPGPISYNLQVSGDGTTWAPAYSGTSTGPTLRNNTDGKYSYRVQACADGVCSGFSPASPLVQIYIQPSALPNFNVPATAYNNSPAIVSFSLPVPAVNGGALTYTIKKSDSTNNYNQPIWASAGTSTTSSFTYNETSNGIYSYEVSACDSNNASLCTDFVVGQGTTSVTLSPTSDGGPVHVPSSDTNLASWEVTWPGSTITSGTGTINYNLYQLINGGSTNGGTTAYIGSQTLHWMYTPVNNEDATYTYEIQACVTDPVSGGPSCTSRSGPGNGYTTIITPALPANVSLGGVKMDGTFTATWTEPSGGAPYDSFLAVSGYQDSPSDPIIWHLGGCSTNASTHSCTFNTQANNTYYVRVQACDQGVCSDWRTGADTVLGGATNPPTLTLPATTTDGTETLTWTAVAPVTGTIDYTLYKATKSSDGVWSSYTATDMGTSRSNAVSLSATTPAKRYYVVACDSNSCAANSAIKTITYVAPAAPVLSGPTSTPDGSVSISWNAPSGATSYKLYRSVDKFNAWQPYAQVTPSGRSYSDTLGLTVQGVRYYVLACNVIDCSNPSNTLVVTNNAYGAGCPPPPEQCQLVMPDDDGSNRHPVRFGTNLTSQPLWDDELLEPLDDHKSAGAAVAVPKIDAAQTLADAGSVVDSAPPAAPTQLKKTPVFVVEARPAALAAVSPPRPLRPRVLANVSLPDLARGGDWKVAQLPPRRTHLMAHAEAKSAPGYGHREGGALLASSLAGQAHIAPAIDPRLSMYPPLRNDPRVMAHFLAMGGQEPYAVRKVDCTTTDQDGDCSEPGLNNAMMVEYQYGAPGTPSAGYLTSIVKLNADGSKAGQLWVPDDVNAMGQVDQATYDAPINGGAGTVQIDDYFNQATGVLGGTQVTTSSGSILATTYAWDGYNNLKKRTVTENGQTVLDEDFSYDSLNRLRTGSTTAGAYNQSATMGYDAEGDFDTANGNGTFGAYHYTNVSQTLVNGTVCTAGHPHALSDVTAPGGAVRSYCYDANGNLESVAENGVPTHQVTWQWFNKPATIRNLTNGANESFLYDADQNRVANTLTQGTGSDTTVYIDGIFESEYNGTTQTYRNYVVAGPARIAVDTYTDGQQTDQLGIFIHDQLGSVIGEVTENLGGASQQLAVYSYDAWGKERPTSTSQSQTAYADLPEGQFLSDTSGQHEGYAGHENLAALGLVEMEGRIYDPEIGRFLSADPNVQFPLSTQGYDRYSYVNDNPLSLNDPSGYMSGLLGADMAGTDLDRWVNPGRYYILRHLTPTEFAIVNMIGSYFCGPFAAACTAAGTYDYARSQGAGEGDAARAGISAGLETLAFQKINSYYQGGANPGPGATTVTLRDGTPIKVDTWNFTRVALDTGVVAAGAAINNGDIGAAAGQEFLMSMAHWAWFGMDVDTDSGARSSPNMGDPQKGVPRFDSAGDLRTDGTRPCFTTGGAVCTEKDFNWFTGSGMNPENSTHIYDNIPGGSRAINLVSKAHDWVNSWGYDTNGDYILKGGAYDTVFQAYSMVMMPVAGAFTIYAFMAEHVNVSKIVQHPGGE